MRRTCLVVWLTVVTGCGGAWEVEKVIGIGAPPELVWNVLADLERYPEWNSYSPKAIGKLEVGEIVRIEAHLGDEVRHVDNVVLEVDPPRTLCWQSQNWYGVLVRGTRCRYLEDGPNRATQFRHYEIMEGALAGVVEWIYRPRVEKGLEMMNADLKTWVEMGVKRDSE